MRDLSCDFSICYAAAFLQLKDLSTQTMFPATCTYIIYVEMHMINSGREYLYNQCVIVIPLVQI